MKQTVVVWVAIILLIGCLIYPPYGYTRYTVKTIYKGAVAEAGAKDEIDHERTVWTYVANAFLFGHRQPSDDPGLEKTFQLHDDAEDNVVSVDNMGIGWHIVAAECAIIILLAGGLLFSMRENRKA